jgi:hypothetical protein
MEYVHLVELTHVLTTDHMLAVCDCLPDRKGQDGELCSVQS